MDLLETKTMIAAAMALPLVTAVSMHVTRAALPRRLLRALTLRALKNALRALSLKGESVLARAAARAYARAAGRQVLGYATLGISIIADIGLATAATSRIGTHVEVLARPWGVSALQVGDTILNDAFAAECTAKLLGEIAQMDGGATEAQMTLFAGHLDRVVYLGGSWSPMDVYTRRMWLDAFVNANPGRCVEDVLARLPARDRRTLVGWTATMSAIDGAVSSEEQRALDGILARIDGSGFVGDGLGLRKDDVEVIRRHVATVFVDSELAERELAEDGIDLAPQTERVWGLSRVSERSINEVVCALSETCPE
jgi:hypothetical protein